MMRKMRTRAYRFSGADPTFAAQWFYGLCRAHPGDEFVFVAVADGLRLIETRLGRLRLRQLDISNGCQAHTVLPYAAPVFAKRLRRAKRRSSARRLIAHGKPAL